MKTVNEIDKRMCVSCGVCKGVCPKDCITMSLIDSGKYVPQIDCQKCISCGICYDCCPAYNNSIKECSKVNGENLPEDIIKGNTIDGFYGKSRNERFFSAGTNGGLVTTIIDILLQNNVYNCAFVVNGYGCHGQLKASKLVKGEDMGKVPQSRYVPVSMEETVRYMESNRNDKVIIVCVSCAAVGILKVIKKFNLNRDNYLILGLFCATYMNYKMIDYLKLYFHKNIHSLLWRTKEENKYWYGSIKAEYKGGSKMVPSIVRGYCKDILKLERCFYCHDLLNIFSDISFGDNNASTRDGKSGSILIRTKRGQAAIQICWNMLDIERQEIEEIYVSQHAAERKRNINNAIYLKEKQGISIFDEYCKENYPEYELDEEKHLKKIKRIYGWTTPRLRKLVWINKIKYLRLKVLGRDKAIKIKHDKDR